MDLKINWGEKDLTIKKRGKITGKRDRNGIFAFK
jgi:hypothetical protein